MFESKFKIIGIIVDERISLFPFSFEPFSYNGLWKDTEPTELSNQRRKLIHSVVDTGNNHFKVIF